jgi:hypothetical protein
MELQAALEFVVADQTTRRHKAEDHFEGPRIRVQLLNTNRTLINHKQNTIRTLVKGKPNTN